MSNHETELEIGKDMSEDSGRSFKKDPMINVISKYDFEDRVQKVFHLLWKSLARSFGPYGAPTIIYNHPWQHVTKDGYTIMKNLSMDVSDTLVDQAIANMASDICGRLNYTVGDGTTSAIIATNSIYQNYLKKKDEFETGFILPRDIISEYTSIKNRLIKKMKKKIVPIRSSNIEELKKNIRDVVYISSNGDEIITDYISELYGEIGAPGISAIIAPDGITKKKLIEGYRYRVSLNDKLYINNDNQTMKLENADVIIFATKITHKTYETILKPLNENSRVRGRHLIVLAPTYDEVAVRQYIAPDLRFEYERTKDINMVLTTYRATSDAARKLLEDFAMLMNTEVIDRGREEQISDAVAAGELIDTIINIDGRKITGIKNLAISTKEAQPGILYTYGEDEIPEGYVEYSSICQMKENPINLGFVRACEIGLSDMKSIFTDLVYNQNRYDKMMEDAIMDLEEKERKYQKLGTFNTEVAVAQDRVYSLKLKMGIIEVGGESELSQKLLKDAVDDAIKAAASAYYNGVVKGCNTNLIQVIYDLSLEDNTELRNTLISILFDGFVDVYKTVLNNGFAKLDEVHSSGKQIIEGVKSYCEAYGKFRGGKTAFDIFGGADELADSIDFAKEIAGENPHVHDVIIAHSIRTGKVFDVSKFEFSDLVINSSQTDEQILTATIDLIGLLIVGNQIVVTQKHNFE